jgi:hypothetical protein
MKNKIKRPRAYRARLCGCGEIANYVVQVQARTLGPGSDANRKTRFGKTVLLCWECSLDLKKRVDELESSASGALNQIRSRPVAGEFPLVDGLEA